MGCLDELGMLEQGQCFIQVSNSSLEKCFMKHGAKFSEAEKNLQVVKGTVVIAKNPCLHPGDVRVLEAVDVPGLHHLYDCLVFPQKGERPHTNEASGSDLDGDLYFVTWDENLIPPSKRSWIPMQYDAAEAKLLARPVNHQVSMCFIQILPLKFVDYCSACNVICKYIFHSCYLERVSSPPLLCKLGNSYMSLILSIIPM
jgi:RNA-dependent RNA polymerase